MFLDVKPPSPSLIARARAGEAAALEELLALVAPAVHRFGLRMCRSAHDADDVLQDTLLSVATHLGDFEGRSSLLGWVFALTRSACARRRRGQKNQPTAPDAQDETASPEPSPEQQAESRQLAEALRGALDGLPEEYREVILLRDIEGLPAPDTAVALGISVDATKSRLHRARGALRLALRPLLEPSFAEAPRTCPDVVALWSQKLDGDLSQADCSAMEAHLVGCSACTSACSALKHALLACQQSATSEISPQVQARVKAAVRALAARA
jgi:RNA polymerase sigma-70 factor (ECF subfamily)